MQKVEHKYFFDFLTVDRIVTETMLPDMSFEQNYYLERFGDKYQ